MQKIICEIVKGWASREWPVLCFQDPSYREHWKDSRPAVCPQVCICICFLYLYSICILICICIWICIGKSASCYEPVLMHIDQSDCQSGQAVLLLLHNELHPNHGGRLLWELQEEVLHWIHPDQVKTFLSTLKFKKSWAQTSDTHILVSQFVRITITVISVWRRR